MPVPLDGPPGPNPLLPIAPLEEIENAPPAAPPNGPIDTLSVSGSSAPLMFSLFSIELPEPKIGLLPFLKILSDMKLDHRYASADTQAEILAINRDFYLSIAQESLNIAFLRETVEGYFAQWNTFINQQNDYIDYLNAGITDYNDTLIQANSQIAILNAAIAEFNQVDENAPEFPAAQATFNAAVDDFNTYVTQTANPLLSNYEVVRQQYNLDTAQNQNDIDDYNVEVEEINQSTGLNLDPVTINAPSAPIETLTELNPASGVGHPNIPPYPLITGAAVLALQNLLPPIQGNVNQIIDPLIIAQAIALKLMQIIFNNISDYNAFLAFVLKTGSLISPAAITAYIADTERPSLENAGGSGGQGGTVSMASSVMGLASPFLEGAVAASLYNASAQKFDREVAQNFIDQLNVLNATILFTAAQKSGFDALATADIESLPPDEAVANTLVTALFIEGLLEIIQNSGETLKPAIEKLAEETLKVPPEQLDAFVNEVLAAQNASLALNAALAIGIATGDTAFVGNLIGSIPVLSDINAQLVQQPVPTVFQALSDSTNQLLIKASLNQDIVDAQTLNQAVNQAIAQNTETTTAEEFRSTLEKNLLAANLTPLQASQLSDQALGVVQSLTTARNVPPPSSTADLAASASSQIAQILAPLGPDIANQIASRIALTLYDQVNPNNTITKLIQEYVEAQTKISDEAREEVVRELLGFVPPAEMQVIKPSILLLQLLDPAYNISKSFMTGLMYDRNMPTNFKLPTDIPI